MGWFSIDKEGTILREETDGRPVQMGEEGKLRFIGQEDFGHSVAIDLINGIIFMDYVSLNIQNNTIEIDSPKMVIHACDDTNILGDLYDIKNSAADSEGWFSQKIVPIVFRPIWFTRMTSGIPTKVIGLQTTLPEVFGGHNVKKMVNLFSDGRVGIS